uniref:Uncharacterized protein n=1 Tax=Podarcis muralis TaxID=64176 RepID=A0A670JCL3_PODMU
MIPSSSKTFLVNDLAAGRDYDLCVLAVYDDGVTSLTATRVVGCVQFTTEGEATQCHSLHTQFLGGTMIIIIGGIIVASVLVFIIILMIRYKVYSGQEEHKKAKVSNVYSQTNGNHHLNSSTDAPPPPRFPCLRPHFCQPTPPSPLAQNLWSSISPAPLPTLMTPRPLLSFSLKTSEIDPFPTPI